MDNIDIAREALIKLRPQATGIASYGCVSADGQAHSGGSSINTACHASCASYVMGRNGVILYTITTGLFEQLKIPVEVKERYFAWLCSKDSPWAECLNNGLNTDSKFVAEYGLLITDMDKLGRNLVIASLAASRACFEHPQHILMWDKLVQDGVEPRWAFFLCGFTTFDKDDLVKFGMRGNQNHWPLHPWSASEEYIKNYLTQNVKFDDVPFLRPSNVMYGSVGGVWGPSGNLRLSQYCISDYWSDFKKKAKVTSQQLDGDFQKSDISHYKDFLEVVKHERERLYA